MSFRQRAHMRIVKREVGLRSRSSRSAAFAWDRQHPFCVGRIDGNLTARLQIRKETNMRFASMHNCRP